MAGDDEKQTAKPAKLSLRVLPPHSDLAIFSGVSELDLTRSGLMELPDYLFDATSPLPATLSRLDVSFNDLRTLPETLSNCARLKVFFAMANKFEEYPEVLGRLPNIGMVSFKSNRIERLSETCLASSIYWLILTDNKIAALPHSIGRLSKLRKFMMASNLLTSLPDELADCTELELIRLADNSFTEVPQLLFSLPKLTWVALGGNYIPPAVKHEEDPTITIESLVAHLPAAEIARREDVELGKLLGEGTSGKIFAGTWKNSACAVKLFKNSNTTSDGRPLDEAAVWCHLGETEAATSPYVIDTLGVFIDGSGSNEQLGVIMEHLPDVSALGLTPSFSSVTRDVYVSSSVFVNETSSYTEDFSSILHLATGFAHSVKTFHDSGIIHGDLYAHNLLVTQDASRQRIVKMGDLGAAFFLPSTDPVAADALKRIEVRAFGIFLSEMLDLLEQRWEDKEDIGRMALADARKALEKIRDRCTVDGIQMRPLADEIVAEIDAIKTI